MKKLITLSMMAVSLISFSTFPNHLFAHDVQEKLNSTNSSSSIIHNVVDFFKKVFAVKNTKVTSVAAVTTSVERDQLAIVNPIDDSKTQKISNSNNFLIKGKSNQSDKLKAQTFKVAEERKTMMKDLAKNDPKKFLISTMSDADKAKLDPLIQALIERKVNVTGELKVVHIDDFKNQSNSKFEYFLYANGAEYNLISPEPLSNVTNGQVRVMGYVLDNLIVLHKGDSSIIPIATQGRESLGNQRTLVLIVDMLGDTSPISFADVKKVIFDKDSPFEKYYDDQSYNRIKFTGNVYRIKLNRAPADECGSGVTLTQPDVVNELKTQRINLAEYERVLFLPPTGFCSEVGKSNVTIEGKVYRLSQSAVGWSHIKYAVENNTLDRTLAHELGHALGVMHSNSLVCDNNDQCTHHEYGNYFDLMGTGIGDFNAFYKEQLGWLDSKSMLTITKTGNYVIDSLESNTNKFKAAKIVNPALGPQSVIYIEKRKKINTDVNNYWTQYINSQRDVLLLNIPQRANDITRSDVELIDMSPESDNTDVALRQGKTFDMPSIGITLGPVGSVNSTLKDDFSFGVNVHAPSCLSKPPSLNNYGGVLATADSLYNLSIRIYDQDSLCSKPAFYTLEFTNLPLGWTVDTINSELNVENVLPRTYANVYANIKIPADAMVGFYTLNYRVRNTLTGVYAAKTQDVVVRPKPQILAIEPKGYKPGMPITISTNYVPEGKEDIYAEVYAVSQFDTISLYSDRINSSFGKIVTSLPANMVPGTYDVVLYMMGGRSEPFPIEVMNDLGSLMTINVDPAPKLSMTYDSAGVENVLTTSYRVNVNNSTDFAQKIPKENAFNSYLRTDNLLTGGKTEYLKPSNVLDTDAFAYLVPPKTIAVFDVKTTFNPKTMFAGTYYGILQSVLVGDKTNLRPVSVVQPNTTNSLTIIGERSPYINSLTPRIVSSGVEVTLSGVRFVPTKNTIRLTNNSTFVIYTYLVDSVDGGQTLKFVPNVPVGEYTVEVLNPTTGNSNMVLLSVK